MAGLFGSEELRYLKHESLRSLSIEISSPLGEEIGLGYSECPNLHARLNMIKGKPIW